MNYSVDVKSVCGFLHRHPSQTFCNLHFESREKWNFEKEIVNVFIWQTLFDKQVEKSLEPELNIYSRV